MPERIQLRRTAGWRKPEGAVVVSRPSRWGNPFRIGGPIAHDFAVLIENVTWYGKPLPRSGRNVVEDAAHAVDLFVFWVYAKVPFTGADVRRELTGRDLACWCRLDQPCHADALLTLAANEEVL